MGVSAYSIGSLPMIAQTTGLPPSFTCSPDEYLEMECASDQRHEYIDGEIIPMAGGTPDHNQLLVNVAGELNFALKREPYRVFAADQRLWIPNRSLYTYPDVMVISGTLVYQENRADTLTNPCLIIEVLSKSTRDYDRGGKFVAYRTISTFREYVLIDQYSYHVEHYTKTGDKTWTLQEYDRLDETLSFTTVPVTILLEDIYTKVTLK